MVGELLLACIRWGWGSVLRRLRIVAGSNDRCDSARQRVLQTSGDLVQRAAARAEKRWIVMEPLTATTSSRAAQGASVGQNLLCREPLKTYMDVVLQLWTKLRHFSQNSDSFLNEQLLAKSTKIVIVSRLVC